MAGSILADYFIIANGNNASQVQAMVDSVEEELLKEGHECRQIEGYNTANWILMDYNDIIVHVFSREDRLFYDQLGTDTGCHKVSRCLHLLSP